LHQNDLQISEMIFNPDGDLALLWPAVVGETYQVQTSSDNSLSAGSWVNIGAPISASQLELSATVDVSPSDTRRFFRVIRVPTEVF